MHYRFVSIIAVTINMMLRPSHSHMDKHTNRHENGDVFNLLLGLYKLNPLRSSQIYKSFSEGVLSGHPDRNRIDLQFESNENNKKQTNKNLNEIERVIHVKNKKHRRVVEKPEYDIEDVDTENFNVDIMLNERISREKIQEISSETDNFSGIFGHIGSNEIDGDSPATKLLPVNDNDTKMKMLSSSENFKLDNNIAFEIAPDKTKEVDKITSYADVARDIQSGVEMADNFDTADVIVI